MLSLLGFPLCASAAGAMPIKHSGSDEGLAAFRAFERSHTSMRVNVILEVVFRRKSLTAVFALMFGLPPASQVAGLNNFVRRHDTFETW
jgi:hypothetical protein